MEMVKDMWTPEHEKVLQAKQQRIMAEHLEQQGLELAQQREAEGDTPVTELVPGVPIDNN